MKRLTFLTILCLLVIPLSVHAQSPVPSQNNTGGRMAAPSTSTSTSTTTTSSTSNSSTTTNKIDKPVKTERYNSSVDFVPNVKLPGFNVKGVEATTYESGKKYITVDWIAAYVLWAYKYMLGIAGVFAVIVIMYAGFLYITAAGDAGKISQAKSYVSSSVFGLVIVFGITMIVNYVNPAIGSLKPIYLDLPDEKLTGLKIPKECKYDSKSSLYDKSGFCKTATKLVDLSSPSTKKDLEKLNVIIQVSGLEAMVQPQVLSALKIAGEKLTKKNNTTPQQLELIVFGGRRNTATQEKICACADTYNSKNNKSNADKGCPVICGNFCQYQKRKPTDCNYQYMNGRGISVKMQGKFSSARPKLDCGPTKSENTCRTNENTNPKQKRIDPVNKKNPNYCKPHQALDIGKYQYCQDHVYDLMKASGFKVMNSSEWWSFYK